MSEDGYNGWKNRETWAAALGDPGRIDWDEIAGSWLRDI